MNKSRQKAKPPKGDPPTTSSDRQGEIIRAEEGDSKPEFVRVAGLVSGTTRLVRKGKGLERVY